MENYSSLIELPEADLQPVFVTYDLQPVFVTYDLQPIFVTYLYGPCDV